MEVDDKVLFNDQMIQLNSTSMPIGNINIKI